MGGALTRGLGRKLDGVEEAAGHLTGRNMGVDGPEELFRNQCRMGSGRGGNAGGDGDGHRAGRGLWMGMGDRSGLVRFLDDPIDVTGEPRAQRGDAHGGAVAKGALAPELRRRDLPPWLPAGDRTKHLVHRGPVSAGAVIPLGEAGGQGVAVDTAVLHENFQDRQRHVGVVGPAPWWPGNSPLDGQPGSGEELFPQRVPDGQTLEGVDGESQACGVAMHVPWRLASSGVHCRASAGFVRCHTERVPRDPLVARALTVLPEITGLPEWEAQVVWYRERGFDFEELSADSLVYWVLGPWMARLLDEGGDAQLLARLLETIEELMTSGDAAVKAAAEGMIEAWLFRAGRDGQAAGLVGAATARHLAHLHEKWAPWKELVAFLTPQFDEIIAEVTAEYPGLSGATRADVDLGVTPFTMYASVMYAPASQRFEDLLVYLSVSREKIASFEVGRGNGELLTAEFPSLLLKGEPGMASYDMALRDYCAAAMDFTREHLPSILPALAQPFDRE